MLRDEGFAALEKIAPYHVESVREHLIDRLTLAQLEQLREISESLLDHLAPDLGIAREGEADTALNAQ